MKNPKHKQECKNGLIRLYSAQQFANTADKKELGKCHNGDEIKFKIKFISDYQPNAGPSIYFSSIVSLLAVPSVSGVFIKKNIAVRNICFKNEINVSVNSRTDEYGYLYDISCSPTDNSDCSSDSHSSSCSLSLIINKGIEKQIAASIVEFFSGPYFTIQRVNGVCSVTLDVSPNSVNEIFPVAKAICKYTNVSSSSSSCSSSSSSSSCSSSSIHSCHKQNNIVKLLILAGIILMIVSLFFKNNNGGYDAYSTKGPVKSIIGGVYGSFKSLLGLGYSAPPTPVYQEPEPVYQKSA
jgi:hypothetical protein